MSEKQIIEALDAASMPSVKNQRQAILELEKSMLHHEQTNIPVEHLVHGGIYARAVTVKAGTLLTGQIYKFDHIELMTSGNLLVTTDDAQSRHLQGFNMMPALSGKKRAAYALTDTTWVTFHTVGDPGDKSGEELQEQLTAETFEDLENFYNDVNRADYALFLQELGINQEYMDAIVKNCDDYVEINLEEYGLRMGDSPIHGLGVFATESFEVGQPMGCSRVGEYRTQLGRYINNAVRPNCKFVIEENDVICVASKAIQPGDELTVSYKEILTWRSEVGDL